LADIAAAEPEAVAAWLADPNAAPHGGESLTALVGRVADWLDSDRIRGRTLAVTHAAVMRAAVVHVLGAPVRSFWRIDVAPLSIIELRRNGRRWTLHASQPPSPGRGKKA
jgi:broad specificity phosphatase PhoE